MLYKQMTDCQGLRIDWHEIIIAELQLMIKITTFSLSLHTLKRQRKFILDNQRWSKTQILCCIVR